MKNSKGNSTVAVIIAVVLTALIVGGASYYMFKQPSTKQAVVNEECYKTYTEGKVSFAYLCDWETNVKGKNTWSAVGTVVAPDGKASFHYPAPDLGLHGTELTNEGSVTINGNDYSTKTYTGNGETLVLVEMGTALNEYGYDLMLAYQSSAYQDELDHILETFEF